MDQTKSALIEAVGLKTNLPFIKAEALVNAIFDGMRAALLRGERIEVRGFGTFKLREYRAYLGRNPRSGEPVPVPKKRSPYFRPAKELRVRVNSAPSPLAKLTDGMGTGKAAPESEPAGPPKNAAAVARGRLGGLKGGKARAAILSKQQLSEIGKVAAKARWEKSR